MFANHKYMNYISIYTCHLQRDCKITELIQYRQNEFISFLLISLGEPMCDFYTGLYMVDMYLL